MGDKSYATGIQFATHSYLTRQTWHTGAGLQLEWLHDESSISLGSKNQMAWSLGWHVMSNPAGRFLIGANYKNKDLMVLPFERQPITLNQILSCQLGGSIAISRKSSASLLAIFKRCSVQEEQQYWYHVSGNVNFRKWTAGLGWKNWGSGQGMLTRVGLYYRNWMAAYVSTNSNFNFSRNSFLHEISLSKKF
jgi:hypothetical protein